MFTEPFLTTLGATALGALVGSIPAALSAWCLQTIVLRQQKELNQLQYEANAKAAKEREKFEIRVLHARETFDATMEAAREKFELEHRPVQAATEHSACHIK